MNLALLKENVKLWVAKVQSAMATNPLTPAVKTWATHTGAALSKSPLTKSEGTLPVSDEQLGYMVWGGATLGAILLMKFWKKRNIDVKTALDDATTDKVWDTMNTAMDKKFRTGIFYRYKRRTLLGNILPRSRMNPQEFRGRKYEKRPKK